MDTDPAEPIDQPPSAPLNPVTPTTGDTESTMEQDEDQILGASGGGDNSLLHQIEHQFSCMATTDKDVLVKQLQKMVGESVLNEYAAAFFLDMNNWNLQLAVGSYFDLIGNSQSPPTPLQQHQLQNLHQPPRHSLITSPSPILGSTPSFSCTSIPSSTHSVGLAENKAQQVEVVLQNDGQTRWPPGCCLRYVQGDLNVAVMDYCDTNEGGGGGGNGNQWTIDKIGIQEGVEPLATTTVKMTFLCVPTPITPSQIEMHWQMCTPDGYLFGQLVHFQISVGGGATVRDVVEQFGRLGQ